MRAAYRFPVEVEWNVTMLCNQHCVFCSVESPFIPDHRMVLDERFADVNRAGEVLENIRRAGALVVTFAGGEPTVHPHFKDFVRLTSDAGFLVNVISNGTRFTPDLVEELARSRTYWTQVSVHGHTAAAHDPLMGRGSFEKAIEGIQRLRSEGLRVVMAMVYMKNRNQQVVEYLKLARSLDVSAVILRSLLPIGRARPRQQAEEAEYRAEQQLAIRTARELGLTLWTDLGSSEEIGAVPVEWCNIGRTTVAIFPQGEIASCAETPVFVGNIYTDDLQTVWEERLVCRHEQFRERIFPDGR